MKFTDEVDSWTEILRKFIKQASTGDLKVSAYPKSQDDLKVKVSFGMRNPARIPWIAFTAPGMQVSNGFYPVYLYYKDFHVLILAYGVSETEESQKSWPAEIMNSYQTIKSYFNAYVPRYGESFVFKSYKIEEEDGRITFLRDNGNQVPDKEIESDLSTLLDHYQKIVSNRLSVDFMIYGIIYHTDKDWLDYLKSNYSGGEFNFWTTGTKQLNAGDHIPLFFKTGDGKIVGMAELVRKEFLTVGEMWEKYGTMNGTGSRSELEERFSRLSKSNNGEQKRVRCLILEDFAIFTNPIPLSLIGSEKMQVSKYIRDEKMLDTILSAAGVVSISGKEQILNPDAIEPKFRKAFVNSRLFQGNLRQAALEYYHHRCLLCGIDIDDLLVVSHIKDVSLFPGDAGNPYNTLLLCRLHDGMFDRKLISIGNDNRIIVGNILKNSRSDKMHREVQELESTIIDMDLKESREFLEWHRSRLQ